MSEGTRWETADPLGLGGVLMDACRIGQLVRRGTQIDPALLPALLEAALAGLRHYRVENDLRRPPSERLAFRELGLAIGLQALPILQSEVRATPERPPPDARSRRLLDALEPYQSMGAAIRSFWLSSWNRDTPTWFEHRDINEVMLATSLVPEGFLILQPVR
jgi:hypothetical protein